VLASSWQSLVDSAPKGSMSTTQRSKFVELDSLTLTQLVLTFMC
jgi:hypothetical protein